MPMSCCRNTAPGREQRERGKWEGGKEENNLQAQSAATWSVPGKNLTRLPADLRSYFGIAGGTGKEVVTRSGTTTYMPLSSRRSTQLVTKTLCAGAHWKGLLRRPW